MIITVDTGGTKTLVTSFSSDGRVGELIKFPTPKTTDGYITVLKETLETNYGDKKVRAISVALPGIIKNDIAVWCNNLKWSNFDLKKAMGNETLGGAPIYIENDANLAGLAETRAIKPLPRSSLYITISTGIGSGIITNGYIDPGLRYSEAGRALIEYDGVVREWESFASGSAIVQTYGKRASEIKNKRQWYKIADRISRGFLAVIPIIQPDVIIIGGGVGTHFQNFKQPLIGLLKEHLPNHIPLPKIIQAKHPEQAVIYGAFYYASDIISGKQA